MLSLAARPARVGRIFIEVGSLFSLAVFGFVGLKMPSAVTTGSKCQLDLTDETVVVCASFAISRLVRCRYGFVKVPVRGWRFASAY